MSLVLRSIFDEGGLSMDSPWTDVGLLKTVSMCLLDRKCPCELDSMDCVENDMLMHVN